MDSIVAPLRSRRFQRGQFVQKLNHVIPALGLLAAGTQALTEGARGFDLALAVVEIATSAMLVVTVVRGLRVMRHSAAQAGQHSHATHTVDWIDIWAAGVLFVEAAERWHSKHHIARPTILTAFLTLGLGLFHERIAAAGWRRRAIRLTDDGIYIGGKPFRTFRASWRDVTSISIADRTAEVRSRGGKIRQLDFSDLENASEVRAVLEVARSRIGPSPTLDPVGNAHVSLTN